MKVMLVFPPQFDVTMPSLGLPCLTAALRSAGHEVVQKDINIESFNRLLCKEELEKAHFSICMNRRDLLFSGANPNEIERLISKGKYLVDGIKTARNVLSNKEEFYDFQKYFRSISIIKDSMRLLSMAYYPTQLTFYSYRTGYSAFSTKEIMEAVKDEKQNLYIHYYKNHVIKDIIEQNPRVLGISIGVDSQVIPGLTLAYMVKQALKDTHIVIGGSFFTRLSENIKDNQALFSIADSFMLHEGETAMLKLLECIECGQSLDTVPNLIYKEDNRIIANEHTCIEDVTGLPTPDFDGLTLEDYMSPGLTLPIYATRGCYWGRCAFCSFYLSASGKFRYRGADRIIEDIKILSERYNCTNFTFMDEAIPPKFLVEIADRLIEEGILVNWSTHTRFERQFDEVIFKKLYDSGCCALGFGLESASDRVLKAMNKGTESATIKRVLKASKKAGLANHVSLFFGFPTETHEEADSTIRFVLNNLECIDSICYESFNLVQGSRAFENAENYGISEMKCNDEYDMSMDFEYEIATGLNSDEAKIIKEQFSKAMLETYKSIQMINSHEALYFSRYKGQDLAWLTASDDERMLGEEAFREMRRMKAEEALTPTLSHSRRGRENPHPDLLPQQEREI